jgi:hypothetical protein
MKRTVCSERTTKRTIIFNPNDKRVSFIFYYMNEVKFFNL